MEHSPTAEILRLYFLGTIVQKSPTAKILSKYFLRKIARENICVKFPLLGSFVAMNLKKPKKKVSVLPKLTKPYFRSA